MIMPCMNSTSALKGALGGVRTVASVRDLPGWPGAPGCTMGLDCCADAAIALSKKSGAVRDRLQRAMRYYTIRVLGQSNPMERSARPPIAKRVWFDADEFFNIALSETESEGSERGMNHLTDFALLAQP